MVKKSFLVVLVMVSIFVLAACGPASMGGAVTPGSATGGTPEVPQTGVDTKVPTTSDGGAAATCVGVDTQQLMTAGQTYYATNCASCHGQNAEGQGDFPALAGNVEVTTGTAAILVQKYLSVPDHPKTVTPENLASALTYVRGSFGNTGTMICPTDVKVPAGQ